MRITPNKTLAVLLVIVTTFGLLLSLFFVLQIWRFRQPTTEKLQSVVNQTSEFLNTTDVGLEIIDRAVKNVYTSTVNLGDSTKALADSVHSTSQFIDLAGDFMGGSLVNTITNTQRAIESAQASAVVIDNILTTLSKVPLIGIKYNPTRPLNVALGDVADSLSPLQRTLKDFQANLSTAQADMQVFGDQIRILDQNITAINKNLKATQVVIDNYQVQVKSILSWIETAELSLPNWITILAWIMTLIILWLILIQAGILLFAIQQFSIVRVDTKST